MVTSVAFFFASVILTNIVRRLGWGVSRRFLYTASRPAAALVCLCWGAGVAVLMSGLIGWLHPYWLLAWIFGYGQGAYASIPHYGLVAESTIPEQAMPRQMMLYYVPLVAFIAVSVPLAMIRGH